MAIPGMLERLKKPLKVPAIALGTSPLFSYDRWRGYTYLWFGALDSADSPPIPWRILSTGGNGGTCRDREGNLCKGPLFLLANCVLGTHKLSGEIRRNFLIHFLASEEGGWSPDRPASVWQNSDARKWCQHFEEACFGRAEQDAILSTFKSDGEYRAKRDAYNPTIPPVPAAPDILNGDRVFFLSDEEAETNAYGFKDKKVYTAGLEWWTRSFEGYDQAARKVQVGIVLTHFGGLLHAPATPSMEMYARPALNLNPDTVLLTSGAEEGMGKEKTLPQGPAALKPVSKASKRKIQGWKLTLKDKGRETFSAGTPERKGNILEVPYFNAPVYEPSLSPNERISAAVTDSGRTVIKYYGNIALPLSGKGTAQVDLSSFPLEKGDRLFVFSEQFNGNQRTDYSSPLVQVL